MSAVEHFDDLETRTPDLRARDEGVALAAQVAHAKAETPAYAEILGDVEPGGHLGRRGGPGVAVSADDQGECVVVARIER